MSDCGEYECLYARGKKIDTIGIYNLKYYFCIGTVGLVLYEICLQTD